MFSFRFPDLKETQIYVRVEVRLYSEWVKYIEKGVGVVWCPAYLQLQ